jgi:secretion/DNA translocation related TadE-like protein
MDESARRGRHGSRAIGSERGSVSVLAAAVMLMVVIIALATADVARALAAASRAQSAADAAALAAAQEIVEPTGQDPSAAAARFAQANGAQLVACDCQSGSMEAVATVSVEINGLLLLRSGRVTTATARAVISLTASPRGLIRARLRRPRSRHDAKAGDQRRSWSTTIA